MYYISLFLCCVSYVINNWISGCCIKLLMSFTNQVTSGNGILFFIMSNLGVVVASQSVVRLYNVELTCRHSLQVGSIPGLFLAWKYSQLLCPVVLLIHVLSIYVPISSIYMDLVYFFLFVLTFNAGINFTCMYSKKIRTTIVHRKAFCAYTGD